jgi:hypothetical protein
VGVRALEDNMLEVESQTMSLTQVILTSLPLDRVESLRLEERSTTPGTLEKLELHQTTRLRAIGTIDGEEIDLTELCVCWSSEEQWCVPVYQAGLVQRLRDTTRDITITAAVPNGPEASVVVKGLS